QEKILSKEEKNRLEEINSTSTRPDYTFKIGNQKLAFLDAKAATVNIETSTSSAFQIKSYGWSILAPCSFLTNFEEFAIYDCTYVPNKEQQAMLGRIYLKIEDYVDNFELLETHLLKSNILNGSLSKLYSDTLKTERNIQKLTPDLVFAEQLSAFRLSLAKNIVENNDALIISNSELLAYLTQVIINRVIFIRICEARKIERDGLILSFQEKGFWNEFKNSSYNEFFEHYDGPLFDRINSFQELEISDEVFAELINLLYYPSPYRFDVIPTKLLSDIYEIFLSKKLLIEDGEVSEKLKLEYIKINGAISTPQYLVQDLLKRTILPEELLENGFDSFFETKILDFA
ncbi:MAG: restriction endonuclease subunit M, partial [Bacteroidales bacterium]|nr:restriction endonuclease subunit M [Bacteroidales bacterium]